MFLILSSLPIPLPPPPPPHIYTEGRNWGEWESNLAWQTAYVVTCGEWLEWIPYVAWDEMYRIYRHELRTPPVTEYIFPTSFLAFIFPFFLSPWLPSIPYSPHPLPFPTHLIPFLSTSPILSSLSNKHSNCKTESHLIFLHACHVMSCTSKMKRKDWTASTFLPPPLYQ